MKKIFLLVATLLLILIIIQTVRYNYDGRNVSNFEFTKLDNNLIQLNEVFDKKDDKLILYILPECNSCMKEIDELSTNIKFNKYQIIIISAGLKKFDYQQFYKSNFKNNEITFLIDKNNTFYRDFGLGFTEEFPTLLKYSLNRNEIKQLNSSFVFLKK
jgi:hypothetical protein